MFIPDRKATAAARGVMRARGVRSLFSGVGTNPKTAKGESFGYLTAILHLAPADISGYETCPKRSPGCTNGCLNDGAGNPVYAEGKKRARIARTRFLFEYRDEFVTVLLAEIALHVKRAADRGLIPAVRLNGTSDIVWERIAPEIFERFPDTVFYDYTKVDERLMRRWSLPDNYHLTLSQHEKNADAVARVIADNPAANIAVVFDGCGMSRYRGKPGHILPATYAGRVVTDADVHDLRFLDPPGTIAGLRAKGKAIGDTSGFVVQTLTIGGLPIAA